MISGTPSLFVSSLSSRRPAGVESFVDRSAREYVLYGTGKVALRDGLAGIAEPGATVLLPSYLPDAVAEPLYELDLEPRYYAVERTLAPDLADLERRLDHHTAAVLSVNYFGFPMPGLAELQSLVDEVGCFLVDDNAHAPLSVDDGTLLGTRGAVGITSLWKLLPIPNGAVLYLNGDDAIEGYEPSDAAGVQSEVTGEDYRFVLKSTIGDLLDEYGPLRRSIDAILSSRRESMAVGGPRDRYESGKTKLSKLSARMLEKVDPEAIRTARRENYRAWRRVFANRSGVEPIFERLPDGICPQVFPLRTADPEALRSELEDCGVGGPKFWPRLSPTVRDDPEYETANRLASEILTLPVHQHVDAGRIEAVGERLRR